MAKTGGDLVGPSTAAQGQEESGDECQQLLQRCDERSARAKQHLAASQHGRLIRASTSPPPPPSTDPVEEPADADESADGAADESADGAADKPADDDEIPLARLVTKLPLVLFF